MISFEVFVGRCLQLAGKIQECLGALTGNELSRARGYQMVVIGQMRVLGGRATSLLRYCTPRQALEARTVVPMAQRLTAGGPAP
jgi:uncharacterized protein YjbJ (UPF0337 family)